MTQLDLKEMYMMMKGFADNFDLDNILSMLEQAKKFRIPDSERKKFDKIKQCVDNVDWDALEQLL